MRIRIVAILKCHNDIPSKRKVMFKIKQNLYSFIHSRIEDMLVQVHLPFRVCSSCRDEKFGTVCICLAIWIILETGTIMIITKRLITGR